MIELLSRCCGEENRQPSPAECFCNWGACWKTCQYFSGPVVFSKCALSVVNFRVIAHISSNCWQFSDPDFQRAEISQVRCGFTSGLQRCWLRNHPNPCKSDSSPWPKIKWHQQISPGIGSDVGPHFLNWTWQTKTKGPFVHFLMLIHSDNLSLKESRTCWTCWTHAQNIET